MKANDPTPPRIHRPLLIVVSSPSGGGKTTLCDRLRAERPETVYSVSCTTRAPRGGEVDGREYHFLSPVEFERRVAAGDFLEHAVVHGNRYGTLRQTVVDALTAGRDVLMAIDVQGAAAIRRAAMAGEGILRQAYVDIFVAPPSIAALRERLQKRSEDAPAVIARRVDNAVAEMARWREYRYLVINDELERASAEFRAIVAAEHCRIPG